MSIACVSAGDADDIAVQTVDDVAVEISQDSSQGNLLGVSNENVLLTGSSKDLQSLINNVSEGGNIGFKSGL
ncbi:MAG: hypothetical protein IJI42_02920 [Methanobrevibacter sp.]|nr:hypothetical protein [Methanobrevibacter sp.]